MRSKPLEPSLFVCDPLMLAAQTEDRRIREEASPRRLAATLKAPGYEVALLHSVIREAIGPANAEVVLEEVGRLVLKGWTDAWEDTNGG